MEDVYDLWVQRENRLHNELRRRPVCVDCDEPIQAEKFYLINGDYICPDCMETHYAKNTEDYCE